MLGSTSYFNQFSDTFCWTTRTYQAYTLPKGPLTGPPCPKGTSLDSSSGWGWDLALLAVVTGLGLVLEVLSAIGIASGSSCFSWGCDLERPLDSLASTFCACVVLAGKGMALTRETPMASPPPPAPQVEPDLPGRKTPNRMIIPVRATCSPTESARGRPRWLCSRKMSVSAAILVEGLSNDTDVSDTGAFNRIHDRGEGSEGDILVGANEDGLVLRVTDSLAQTSFDVVDIDGVVAEEDALLRVDADDQALLSDFFDGAGLGNVDFDA